MCFLCHNARRALVCLVAAGSLVGPPAGAIEPEPRHSLTLEDHKELCAAADWHTQQCIHYLEMATGPLNQLQNPDKRAACKESILGAIPGVAARVPKATWMGALLGALHAITNGSFDAYYDCRDYLDRADYHAARAEEIYELLESDWDRREEHYSIYLEMTQE